MSSPGNILFGMGCPRKKNGTGLMRIPAEKKRDCVYYLRWTRWTLQGQRGHESDRSLVTQANRIIETGSDDPSVPLNSSYGSFGSSLNLDVDFCRKNVGTLEQRMQMKGGTPGRKTTSWPAIAWQHCDVVPSTGTRRAKSLRVTWWAAPC